MPRTQGNLMLMLSKPRRMLLRSLLMNALLRRKQHKSSKACPLSAHFYEKWAGGCTPERGQEMKFYWEKKPSLGRWLLWGSVWWEKLRKTWKKQKRQELREEKRKKDGKC